MYVYCIGTHIRLSHIHTVEWNTLHHIYLSTYTMPSSDHPSIEPATALNHPTSYVKEIKLQKKKKNKKSFFNSSSPYVTSLLHNSIILRIRTTCLCDGHVMRSIFQIYVCVCVYAGATASEDFREKFIALGIGQCVGRR